MSVTTTSVLDQLDTVATLAAGLFAGTALYVTIGETPALQEFGVDEHWRFFPLMFHRAAALQSATATVAGLAAVAHGTRIVGAPFYRNLWFAAGSVFIAIFPYTMFVMMPTNKFIINDNKRVKSATDTEVLGSTKKATLEKWAALHLVRTIGSLASFGAMIYGLSRHTSLILS